MGEAAVPLTSGQRLGPYEVLGLIGAGGMGEVYRARDTRLERTVAIKVLPESFASEPTLRARFEREARAISALSHPHICMLHDVGEQDGRAFLVMEHLEGKTLAERLKNGPLPLPEALVAASQISDALSAAHRQGIVHRDLKPGNVMLTKRGVKLLDFGLARFTEHGQQPATREAATVPTASLLLTSQGTIMGTIPYMAPEQLEGGSADARTDLWALGAVVYEMVSGRRAFEGQSQASLIGAILEREPAPLSTLQPLTPPSLERLVRRCLAKSPDDRWESAHDVADELRWIAERGAELATQANVTSRSRRGVVLGLLALSLGLGAVLGGLVARRFLAPAVAEPQVVRSTLDVGPADEVNAGGALSVRTPAGSRTALAWTPDGRALVFVGRKGGIQQLYVRELAGEEAWPIKGTEGAQAPAVSPDGKQVAFWADGALRSVPFDGGEVTVIAKPARVPMGLIWGHDGRVIVDSVNGSIVAVAAEEKPIALTKRLEDERRHVLPQLLPGGRTLLFTVCRRDWTWGDEEVVAQDLATGERKVLLKDATDARYLDTGHLLFMRRGTLFAVGFDPERLEVKGAPVPILDGVAQALTAGASDDVTGAGQYTVAANGSLAYVRGALVPYGDARLVAVDRQGRVTPLEAPVQSYAGHLSLSPDGHRLAIDTKTIAEEACWIFDLERGTMTKLASGGDCSWPRWTPDGERLSFPGSTRA